MALNSRYWVKKSSDNLFTRLMSRECGASRSGAQVNDTREFYERITPNVSIQGIDVPDIYIRKFVDDGQHLICFSHCQQYLLVYLYTGLNYCVPGDPPIARSADDLPSQARTFDGHFKHLYTRCVALGADLVCKDFCVVLQSGKYLMLASSTRVEPGDDASIGLDTLPVMASMTLHIVLLANGEVCDRMVFEKDLMHLSHNAAVSMHNDLVALLSIRKQCLHIMQVTASGLMKVLWELGPTCLPDDQLYFRCAFEEEQRYIAAQSARRGHALTEPPESIVSDATRGSSRHQTRAEPRLEEGPSRNAAADVEWGPSGTVLGIKQRLLVHLYRDALANNQLRIFYASLPKYMDLIMTKVQMLDQSHLLIKYADMTQVVLHLRASRSSSAAHQTLFFCLYNMATTRVEGFFPGTCRDLHTLFAQFSDHLLGYPAAPAWSRYASNHSSSAHVLEVLQKQASCVGRGTGCVYVGENGRMEPARQPESTGGASPGQVMQRMLANLPMSPQSTNPSPYFDQSLFRYDEKLISASERPKPCVDHPIKFLSRKHSNKLRFKVDLGHHVSENEGRTKRIVSYVFHPVLPFGMSTIVSFMQPQHVNVHFRV